MDTKKETDSPEFKAGIDRVNFGVSIPELESPGLITVKKDLINGKYHNLKPGSSSFVSAWIEGKGLDLKVVDSAKREAREKEILSIAKEARSDARLANRIAITAAVIAVISL